MEEPSMPRGPRLDAPGTLQHVIVRGIERRRIVDDDQDRERLLTRLGDLAQETHTAVCAWALMDNHAHLLVRSGPGGLPGFMRRLLTGHATYYNRRHRRHGHLFQNRYKSIVCEEAPYFKELVRYIHLNPLRAGAVENLASLEGYRWCGHACLLGKRRNPWQAVEEVLRWFGETEKGARAAYRRFVSQGVGQGHRPELTGGGLVRSQGGWSAVKGLRGRGEKAIGDERILGSGDFVRKMVAQATDRLARQLSIDQRRARAEAQIQEACRNAGIGIEALRSGSRVGMLPGLRRELARFLVLELGLTRAEAARRLGVSTSGVAQILRRIN
jgi:REP element-mobilizing transposase RayT